jgi:high-affinity iron transporter
MFKIAIVIFRECLEIALLLGIILASTSHIRNSRIYIIMGAMIGAFLASIFAFSVRAITVSYGTYGDEIFDSGIILLTALIISWTVVWMQGYTQKIKKDLGHLSEKITTGAVSKLIIISIVATTILREGAEILLFVYSISSAENISATEYVIGLGIGSLSGFLVGLVLYLGLIKLAGKYIFRVSTVLLTLIAAGLASQAAGLLTSVGVIELYSNNLWDSSWLADNNSIVGKMLSITIGYDSKPNGMQVIFYLGSIALTLTMMKIRSILTSKKKHA